MDQFNGHSSLIHDGKSANLDLLRAIAVLSVFAHHALQLVHVENGPGKFGVLIFFVHTCLVLLISLERLDNGKPGLVRSFYLRRAFRIYPLAIACVLLILVFHVPYDRKVGGAFAPFQWPAWRDIGANLALVQNLTGSPDLSPPLWSLPYEVQMYLALPFIYLFLRRLPALKYAIGLWAFGIAISVLEKWTFGTGITYYAGCFLGGAVGYRILGTVRPRIPAAGWLIAILGLMTYYKCLPHIGVSQIVCFFLGVSFPLFLEVQNAWVKQIAGWIAKYSYGIYLSHMPILWFSFVRLANHPVWLRAVSLVLLVVLIPVAAYHFLEYPMVRIGARLGEQLRTVSSEPDMPKFKAAAGGTSR